MAIHRGFKEGAAIHPQCLPDRPILAIDWPSRAGVETKSFNLNWTLDMKLYIFQELPAQAFKQEVSQNAASARSQTLSGCGTP